VAIQTIERIVSCKVPLAAPAEDVGVGLLEISIGH